MKVKNWKFEVQKFKSGNKKFIWTSTLNPDIHIVVQKESTKVTRDSPGRISTLLHLPNTPSYPKYLGWFVRYWVDGETNVPISASVRDGKYFHPDFARDELGIRVHPLWKKPVYSRYPMHFFGPFTQEHALNVARYLIQDRKWNNNFVKPRQYDLKIPGWELEKANTGLFYRWTNENDGRHSLLLKDNWDHTFDLIYNIGYADDPPEDRRAIVIQKKLPGKAAAVKVAKEYAAKLEVPIGSIEKHLLFLKNPLFAKNLKNMPDKLLSQLTGLIEDKSLTPDQAVEYILRRNQDTNTNKEGKK